MREIAKAFWSIPPSELLGQLDTTPKGLTDQVAKERLKEFRAIRLKPQKGSKALSLFLSQFKSPIIIILLLAAGLSFFLHDPTDALIILAIVFVSGLLGFWQENGAANAVEKLLSIVQTKATVLRDGNPVEVSFEEVVPGDIVIPSAGGSVPGDCMILESKDLFLNEAALTGETYPVEKRVGNLEPETPLARRVNTLFMGTHVVSGTAKAVVVHVGADTDFQSSRAAERAGRIGYELWGNWRPAARMLFKMLTAH